MKEHNSLLERLVSIVPRTPSLAFSKLFRKLPPPTSVLHIRSSGARVDYSTGRDYNFPVAGKLLNRPLKGQWRHSRSEKEKKNWDSDWERDFVASVFIFKFFLAFKFYHSFLATLMKFGNVFCMIQRSFWTQDQNYILDIIHLSDWLSFKNRLVILLTKWQFF